MHDSTVMKARFDIACGSGYKLDIVISEGTGKYDMRIPMEIDPKRLVLSLPMLIVLIYTVRLIIPSSIKLDIHNQCLNVDLVYPVYGTGSELECHRPPDYKVHAGNTMRSAFIIKSDDVLLGGALIYRLQRRQSHGSADIGRDTSNSVHLLVVWDISEFNELYADVLLVECDKRLDWNKYDLEYFVIILVNSDGSLSLLQRHGH
jgi:hypothetical protein